MAATVTFADQALNFMLRGVGGGSPPSAWYLALLTTDPELNGVTGEVTGSGYARKSVTFTAPSGGACANTAELDFGTTPADWGEIGYWAIMNASSSGSALIYGTLDTPILATTGTPVKVAAGEVLIAMA